MMPPKGCCETRIGPRPAGREGLKKGLGGQKIRRIAIEITWIFFFLKILLSHIANVSNLFSAFELVLAKSCFHLPFGDDIPFDV